MITDCRSEADFDTLLRASQQRPVLLFKHSTGCPVSRGAWMRFERFAENNDGYDCRRVLILEDRPLSDMISNQTGIPHESPQVILFNGGSAVWNCARHAINEANLTRQLAKLLP